MSRKFDSGLSQYLVATSVPPGSYPPVTMACWVRANDTDNNYVPFWFGNHGVSAVYWCLLLYANTDIVEFFVRNDPAFGRPGTSTTFSANTWHHICGTSNVDGNVHQIFLDGAGKGTDNTVAVPTGETRVAIGLERDATPGGYMNGAVAEAAIWNAVLTDEEVAMLAKGFSPLLVRPDKLTCYVPLIRDNDKDIVGGLSFLPILSPTIETHPRIIYPGMKHYSFPPEYRPSTGQFDCFINGLELIPTSGDLFIHGYTEIITSGDLFNQGHESFSASGDLFINGHNSIETSGNLFINGSISISGVPAPSLVIHGNEITTDSHDLFIGGLEAVGISGNLFIDGFANISGIPAPPLVIHGNEILANSGNLFINGLETTETSSDLFINGFTNISGIPTPSLFIHGHTIMTDSGNLFTVGSGIIDESGNFGLFINGIQPKPPLACPTLDPTASIQIQDSLITIYQSRIDALINQLGKNVLLEFDPIREPCPNCEFDTMRKRSTGIYKMGGPRPFARGRRCPYCKGRGFTETAVTRCIKCLIQWNPKDAEDFGIAVAQKKDIVRLKTYLTEADDLIRAKTLIVNYDIADQAKFRVKLLQNPIPVGLREDRYCISFWELI